MSSIMKFEDETPYSENKQQIYTDLEVKPDNLEDKLRALLDRNLLTLTEYTRITVALQKN